jgi:hypothetical protein
MRNYAAIHIYQIQEWSNELRQQRNYYILQVTRNFGVSRVNGHSNNLTKIALAW